MWETGAIEPELPLEIFEQIKKILDKGAKKNITSVVKPGGGYSLYLIIAVFTLPESASLKGGAAA